MKSKHIILALLAVLWGGLSPHTAKAQVSVTYSGNSATVTFNLAAYTFGNSDANQLLNINNMNFVSINMADDEYGIIADDGYPALPQLPLLVSIPSNAKNVTVTMKSSQSNITMVPSGKYIEPFVNCNKDGSIDGTGFQAAYYSTATKPYINNFYAVAEPFFIMDEQALDLTILPFQYVPTTGILTELQRAEFLITWTTEGSAAKSPVTQARDDFYQGLLTGYTSRATKGGQKGKLLIITAPQYEQGLSLFKQYKENIGIETQVVSTATTGTQGENIANYIKNSSFKPDFVLLVGSVSTIPAMGNPITDYGYRNFKDKATRYGDVFLGRWPVSNKTELAYAINKTIIMESKLFTAERRVALLAGKAQTNNMEASYVRGNNCAIKGLKKHNYNCEKFERVSVGEIAALQKNYPAWMIYSGKGCVNGSLNYFDDNCQNSITRSFFLKTDVFPLVFSFAEADGNYSNATSMAIGVVDSKGPVVYWGASYTTDITFNEIIEDKILGKSLGQDYVGAIVTKGMTKTAHHFWQRADKNKKKWHLHTYNLMGDPSLNRLGYAVNANYNFDELLTAVGGINLTFNSTNTININQGLQMENASALTFKPTNQLLLKGAITTNKGTLTGESKKITLESDARINSGSIVKLTANEFEFKPGMIIEAESDIVFQAK